MSIWDLRQTIEQSIPWWAPLAVLGLALLLWWAKEERWWS